ncbi:MAG TPA: hypothetical protein VF787_03435 [Thermoanaerobaculia bacterium]
MERLAEWRTDPVQFVRDQFSVEPDRWQVKALRAYARGDAMRLRLAMQACVGPGKTAVLAWIACHFMVCFCGPNGRHPSGLAISESRDNLRDNLWKEIAHWRGQSKLLTAEYDITNSRFFKRGHEKTWFIAARSWPKKSNLDALGRTLAGLHSDFILYLIDESGDIPPAVLRAAEQGLSNCVWGRIVQAGNPTSADGMLYDAVTNQPDKWVVVRITGDPDDEDRSPRIDVTWAQEQIDQWGRTNPWVMYAILGQFPPTAVNALLGPDDVYAAMGKHLRADQYSFSQKRIGIDVARFGDDATVLFPRQGLAGFNFVEMRNADGIQVGTRIIAGKQKFGSELELIDDTGGHGASTIDYCKLQGVNIMPVNFSGSADDPRFYNKRAEINWRAAEFVKNGGALPYSPILAKEALAVRFTYKNGKMIVLEKDQIKANLHGHSPDHWDAFCCTFAVVDLPARAGGGQPGDLPGAPSSQVKSDWDPFADGR